ncbi:MAG TPA: serine hydrolase domain-containing protein [Gemmatimonadales bacterium]|nr:serine hydrolase domain-containing protein [Gemmatimonadales bacterium]
MCDSLAPKIPGLQVAVAVDGQLVWSAAFGYADVARHARVTRTTMFRIGSVSKPLTSTAVVQLVVGGKVDLDAPVQHYVPSFPQKPWPVTTRELAGHLAGIRHYQGNEFLLNTPYPSVTAGLAIFENDSLLFEPGRRFSYSSYGFNLISAVVEGASGEKFLAYMGAHVIRPLSLTHTAPDRVDSLIPDRTTFYDPDTVHGGFQVAPQVDNSYKWAGGGFLSSAEDLVRFASALDHPGFLPQSALDLLFTSQKTRDGQVTGYGVGWFVRTDSLGHRRVFHGGGSVGGTTAFGMDRDAHVAFALTSNLTDAPLGPASRILPLFVTTGNPRGP